MIKKYLKFLIFIFIIFLVPNVFAQDFNVNTSNITSPDASGTGKYSGLEIYNSGSNNVYNIGTRYNGQLSRIVFNLSAGGYADPNGFEQGHTYTLTMNMATDDWRNRFGSVSVKCEGSSGQELSNGRVNYISYKKINFSFTTPSSSWCQFVYVDLKSSNILSTAFTGVSNWNLSSMVITDPMYDDSGSSGGSSGGSTSSNQDIIDNNTANTNNIINNQNSNTNDIIDNANQNTEVLNDSINSMCKDTTLTITDDLSMKNNYYLSSNGTETSLNNAFISRYIKLKPNTIYTISRITGGSTPNTFYYCTYNANKAIYNCGAMPSENSSITFTADSYATYLRVSYYGYRTVEVKGSICNDFASEIQQETNQAINDSTNSIIDNQNSNTQAQIDSQKVCKNYTFSNIIQNNKFLDNAGRIQSGSNAGITDYIDIHSSTIKRIKSSAVTWIYTCFYTDSRTLISCRTSNSVVSNEQVPSNSYYVRFTMHSNDSPNWQICTNGNQALTDSLTDSNIESNLGGGFFDDFTNEDFGFSDIVKIPLNTINQLTSTSCSPISIPIPFTNGSVSLPCMTQIYQDNIPTIYNIWKVVSFGIIAYFIVIDLFHIVKGFKDPESDKVEVLDL